MKIQSILLSTMTFLSIHAFASTDVQGPDVQALNPTDFSSVCLLQVVQPATQQAYLCTGSVISANAILTAGHCVLNDPAQAATAQLSMMCGSQIIRQYPYKNLKVTKPAAKDWVQSGGQEAPTFSKDIAVIRFTDQTLQSTPISVAFDGSNFFGSANDGQINSSVQCLLVGYGRSGSAAGKLHSSPVKDVLHFTPAFDQNPMVVLLSQSQGSLVRDSIDHGDSGGPLLCRQPGGSYAIVGINESGDGGLDAFNGAHFNAFTPVFSAYSSALIHRGVNGNSL